MDMAEVGETTVLQVVLGVLLGTLGAMWILLLTKEDEEQREHDADYRAMLKASRHGRLLLPAAVAAQMDLQHARPPASLTSRISSLVRNKTRRNKTPMSPTSLSTGGDSAAAFDLPPGQRPVLVFVNSKSGGGQGIVLMRQLKYVLFWLFF